MDTNRSPAGGDGGASEGNHAAELIASEHTSATAPAQAHAYSPPARKPLSHLEYLLAEIRLARAHASLWLNHLDTLGVALKANLITPEAAVAELRHCPFFEPIVDRPVIAEVTP
jgi:hypothetical protein